MNRITKDVLVEIFYFLNANSRTRARLVSRLWNQAYLYFLELVQRTRHINPLYLAHTEILLIEARRRIRELEERRIEESLQTYTSSERVRAQRVIFSNRLG